MDGALRGLAVLLFLALLPGGCDSYNLSFKDFYEMTADGASAKEITAFRFAAPPAAGLIDEGAKTIAVTVPFGTVLTGLVPTIAHTGAGISPASGTARDFSAPVIYTVTAADGSAAAYTVTVTVAPHT